MDISPVTQTTGAPAANATPSPGSEALSSDFETFLRMMTTQMRNQDPLDPVDSADFAVQLATFSSVEQQVLTNDLLTALTDRIGGSDVGQMAAWIGREVRSSAPVSFQGQPVTVSVHPQPGADKTELIVRDSRGTEVSRSTVPPGVTTFDWAGVTENGAPLPNGSYTLSTESTTGGDVIGTNPAEFHNTITEVQFSGGVSVLKLANGQTIAIDDVRALSAGPDVAVPS